MYDHNLGAADSGANVDNSRLDIVKACFLKVCWFRVNAGGAKVQKGFKCFLP